MGMYKKFFALLVVIAALFVVVGCGSDDGEVNNGSDDSVASTTPATSEEGTDEEIQTITIASVANMLQLPEFVAIERGFFVEHGLDVQLKLLSSGADINKAVQSGDAEMASVSSSSVIGAWNAGLKLILAVPEMGDATNASYAGPLGIVGRKDSGIDANDPSTLKGKKIAVHEGSTNDLYLATFLAKNGLSMDDIERVPLTTTDHTVSLKGGDVDAATSWEPIVSQNIRELGDNAVVVSRGENFLGYLTGIGGTRDVIDANREAYVKYGTGIAQATQFIRQNPDEAAQDAIAFIEGLDPEVAADALDGNIMFDPRLTSCVQEAFQITGDLMIDAGTVAEVPDTSKLVDPTIMAEVEAQHPEYFDDLPPLPNECEFSN